MFFHERYKSGNNLNILKDTIIEGQLNHFSIGLLILEKNASNQKYHIKLMNTYAYEILELKRTYDFNKLKDKMIEFKKWENNNLQDLNLYNFICSSHITNEISGTFISSISMIYVKIRFYNNEIYISIDNYNDERKELQGNLLKVLKYQYLVTLYHELNNPLNALININDEYTQEIVENNEITLENFQSKLHQINLLVNLIKAFIKNFIWYFTVIFEITNNEKIIFQSKINLEYLFSKVVKKFITLFDYKEISYDTNFSFLNDKFIISNEVHLNNFIRGIFNYIYRNIPKKNGFKITYKLKNNNKIKINFVKNNINFLKSNSFNKRSKIIEDILFNYKKEFNFSNSVQTNEMTKEFLIKLSNLLKIHIKIYNEDDDNIITLILPFTNEKEETEESIHEISNCQKNITLEAINRQISLCEKLQSLVYEKNSEHSTSHCQNSVKSVNNYFINYNIQISTPDNKIIDNNNYKMNLNNINKKTLFRHSDCGIMKLENDPFIKIANEKNPFSSQISQSNEELDEIFSISHKYRHTFKRKKNYSSQEITRHKFYLNIIDEPTINNINSKTLIKQNINLSNIDLKKNNILKIKQSKKVNKATTAENNLLQLVNPNIKKIINNINYPNQENTNNGNNNFDNFIMIKKNNFIVPQKKHLSNLDNPKITLCNCNNILICDDENFNLMTIKNMLKKFNINADTSTNGQECIEAIIKKNKVNCVCDKSEYKLLFLDMMMPIMNGLDCAKKIQEMIDNKEINSDLKIIIISAHIEENLINNLKNIKCIVEEVPKPLKKSKLEEILNTYYFNK
jgi:CheY-like chemotaxis protein